MNLNGEAIIDSISSFSNDWLRRYELCMIPVDFKAFRIVRETPNILEADRRSRTL